MSRACTAQAVSWIRPKFLCLMYCCTNWGGRVSETSRHDYTQVTAIIEGRYCRKKPTKQGKPPFTVLFNLPNSRDGRTTAMSPWFGLLPGVCFFPGSVACAWQMHTGAQHPEHCTPAQFNCSSSKSRVKKVIAE